MAAGGASTWGNYTLSRAIGQLAAGARLNNYGNLRGGLRVPSDEKPDQYYEFLMVVGVYYDCEAAGVPDSNFCSGGAVPVITGE